MIDKDVHKILCDFPSVISRNAPLPKWLSKAAADTTAAAKEPLPLKSLLDNSLYYPCAGLDGTPIKYLSGFIHSFVFADYAIEEKQLLDDLKRGDSKSGLLLLDWANERRGGLKGYKHILVRQLTRDDIVPSGWTPPLLPKPSDGRLSELKRHQEECRPFGLWSLWQRKPEFGDDHGPELLSLLYFGGEIHALYQGLYNRLAIAPKVLAIIQPGSGLGGGWTNIEAPGSFFQRVVEKNPAGMPPFLITNFGSSTKEGKLIGCWPEYSQHMCSLPVRGCTLYRRQDAKGW